MSSPPKQASDRSTVINLLIALRPDQWTKNLLVFAALLFGQRLFDLQAVILAIKAFTIFCALSGAVYLINDVTDRGGDRSHPHKSRRPIAAGLLSPTLAVGVAVVLNAVALGVAFQISTYFGIVGTAYAGLLILYSVLLKHIVVIDVMTIATGFVLRAVAGGAAIDVPISAWLLILSLIHI